MKKIVLMIFAFVVYTSFAQVKNEPSTKETFDFIVNQIVKWDIEGIKRVYVLDYDFDNDQYIKLKLEPNDSQYGQYYMLCYFYFAHLKTVEQIQLNDNYYSVPITFKKAMIWENKSGQSTHKIENPNFTIAFADNTNARKFYKALKHLLKLNNNNASSFFDD